MFLSASILFLSPSSCELYVIIYQKSYQSDTSETRFYCQQQSADCWLLLGLLVYSYFVCVYKSALRSWLLPDADIFPPKPSSKHNSPMWQSWRWRVRGIQCHFLTEMDYVSQWCFHHSPHWYSPILQNEGNPFTPFPDWTGWICCLSSFHFLVSFWFESLKTACFISALSLTFYKIFFMEVTIVAWLHYYSIITSLFLYLSSLSNCRRSIISFSGKNVKECDLHYNCKKLESWLCEVMQAHKWKWKSAFL